MQSRFLSGTGRAEGSIEDNDTWTIEVIADPTSVAEGESRDVKLTARIAPASTECVVPFPVTVSLSATGTATSGTDYRLNRETNDQEIAPCTAETSWPVTMTSNVDTADDDGETVVFTPEIAGTPAIAPAAVPAGDGDAARDARGAPERALAQRRGGPEHDVHDGAHLAPDRHGDGAPRKSPATWT